MLYVIGDVHGCYRSLECLLRKMRLKMSDEVYFVGDVVHKGQDSAKVLALIRQSGWKMIMGNHEKRLLKNFRSDRLNQEIIHSYRGKEAQLLDDIEFLETLPYYYAPKEYDDEGRELIITHGYGYDLLKSLALDSFEFRGRIIKERLPERFTFHKAMKLDAPFFNVFGHVPLEQPLIAPCMAGIDTGCYAGNYLCALSFPDKQQFLQASLG